ncbi:MAG: SDR family oxidoreductase [Methylobacteriaceae bacterium]|nr:SDR family oxidoreductase [Methylobacteriaceae bacterium]
MGSLSGQSAWITGAGTGIGRETAILLAAEGAEVVLIGRREAPLRDTANGVAGAGGSATVLVLDIGSRQAIREAQRGLPERLRGPDILVNNAGAAGRNRNALYIDEKEWSEVVRLNLDAVHALVQAVLPAMLDRKRGAIITVSSLAAVNANLLGGAAYGAAKAAVRNFMGFLHNTHRNEGIRAMTILPGEVDTPILDSRPRPPTPEERARMLAPQDVARAILLCASLPASAMIPELHICPTFQRDISADLEAARRLGAPGGD